MTALKAAIQKEMYSALEETTEDSYQDLKKNVGFFYSAPEGSRYNSGDVAEGQISINTGTQYDPSGRDTQTIFNYAEDNGLLGNGGFWQKTQDDIEKNIDRDFGERFDRA